MPNSSRKILKSCGNFTYSDSYAANHILSPNKLMFAHAGLDDCVLIRGIDGSIIQRLPTTASQAMDFSSCNKFIATANGETVQIWCLASGKLLQTETVDFDCAFTLTFTPTHLIGEFTDECISETTVITWQLG